MEQISLFPSHADPKSPEWAGWGRGVTARMKLYTGTSDPISTEVPKGQWVLYKNTTLNEIRWWVNDDGTMKSSAAFT